MFAWYMPNAKWNYVLDARIECLKRENCLSESMIQHSTQSIVN